MDMNLIEGSLYKWSNKGHVSFISSNYTSPYKIIFLGGLCDGLYACNYLNKLNLKCKENNWTLVQPLFSCSYHGYGTSTLSNDINELNEFILHLKNNFNCEKIILIGHSTGCQISCHLINHGSIEVTSLIYGIILQAPVSDQEAGTLTSTTQYYINWAKNQIQNDNNNNNFNLDSLMPVEAHYSPITIRRFLSLFDRDGEDDYFSSYFTVSELQQKLFGFTTRTHIPIHKVLIVYSMKDEYVPENVNKDELIEKLVFAIGPSIAIPLKLMNSNHNFSEPSDGSEVEIFLESIVNLFNEIRDL